MNVKQFCQCVTLCGILFLLIVTAALKGCDWDDDNGGLILPPGTQRHQSSILLTQGTDPQAKATGLTIEAVGLDAIGNPTSDRISPVTISNPVFPLEIPLTLYVEPCRWRITLTATLTRDTPRAASAALDACQASRVTLMLDTFEPMLVPAGAEPIHAPESAAPGETIVVSCGPVAGLSAPDSDRFPVSAVLSERGGTTVDGAIGMVDAVAGNFPDPYPLTSPEVSRAFTCRIADGRSESQTFTRSVLRILPTPTPTPATTPTVTVTPTPQSTTTPQPTVSPQPTPPQPTPQPQPTVTPQPTAIPTVIPPPPPSTPTPNPCIVQNENDSGAGSLRDILAKSPCCATITFASGVNTITLGGTELSIPPTCTNLTIDGGAGVTVSGNNSSRVFYVNSGADVTLQSLTITNGESMTGGGIYNSGILTIASTTTVSGNTANDGGGIYNLPGKTVTIHGTISSNNANNSGGGIRNDWGTVTVTGTITDNTADYDNDGSGDGGGVATWGVLINGATMSTVFNNTDATNPGDQCHNYYYTLTGCQW